MLFRLAVHYLQALCVPNYSWDVPALGENGYKTLLKKLPTQTLSSCILTFKPPESVFLSLISSEIFWFQILLISEGMLSWMPQPRVNNLIEIHLPISLPLQTSKFAPSQHFGGQQESAGANSQADSLCTTQEFLVWVTWQHDWLSWPSVCTLGTWCGTAELGWKLEVNGNFTICRCGTSIHCASWWCEVYVWYPKKNWRGVDTPQCKNCGRSCIAEQARSSTAKVTLWCLPVMGSVRRCASEELGQLLHVLWNKKKCQTMEFCDNVIAWLIGACS